jgi:BirA family biotin operon repressor/biotin-[acetyl-CoA-carboxylase] ligase
LQNNIFSGLFIGQNLVTLKEVDSTNTYLKHLLSNSKPLPEGTVILAEHQFAGRGQQQNKWVSDPGKNLTFSILFKANFLPLLNQFDLNRVISLGTANALTNLMGKDIQIKWPNDIYYRDNKLGGILIENMINGGQIKYSIAGIGLNINQEHFPAGLKYATSVKQILQTDYDLHVILAEICKLIEVWYLKLKSDKTEELRSEYMSKLYWLNQVRSFRANGIIIKGTIKGVKASGLLEVETEGALKEYDLKQIEFLNK